MTTDDEAVAAAVDPLLFTVQWNALGPMPVKALDLIAASDRIRSLSARVAELEGLGEKLLGQKIALTLRSDSAEAKLQEIANIAAHGIPGYAFSDSEAATEMAGRLDRIATLACGNGWQPIETAPKDGTVLPFALCNGESRKNYLAWRFSANANVTAWCGQVQGIWLPEKNQPTHWCAALAHTATQLEATPGREG